MFHSDVHLPLRLVICSTVMLVDLNLHISEFGTPIERQNRFFASHIEPLFILLNPNPQCIVVGGDQLRIISDSQRFHF